MTKVRVGGNRRGPLNQLRLLFTNAAWVAGPTGTLTLEWHVRTPLPRSPDQRLYNAKPGHYPEQEALMSPNVLTITGSTSMLDERGVE